MAASASLFSVVLVMQVGNDANLLFLFAAVFGMVDYATTPAASSLLARPPAKEPAVG